MKKTLQLLSAALILSAALTFSQATAPAASANGETKAAQNENAAGTENAPVQSASTASSSDDSLRGRIHDQLASDPNLRNVTVSVSRGTAELRGAVAAPDNSSHAREIVAAVPGVKQVRNLIKIGASSNASSTTPAVTSSSNSAGSIAGNTQAANSASAPSAPGANVSAGSTAGAKASTVARNSMPSTLPQSDIETGNSAEGSNLKSQIETALRNEPTLSTEKITVQVTDTAVELQGNVPTSKTKQTAERIAQSYASNRRVTDHITVTGIAPASTVPATPPQAANPDNAEKNKAAKSAPDNSAPKKDTPQTQGDQSTDNPR